MLYEEPKKDGFTHETPIRAFTTWTVEGIYALGKGFRPSLQHLVPYLNAMEKKEGWRLVQILEAGTQTPSFLFRKEHQPYTAITVDEIDSPNLKMAFTGVSSPAMEAAMERFTAGRLMPGTKVIMDPIMPEVRERFYSEGRDFGDEDPSCDDIHKQIADLIMPRPSCDEATGVADDPVNPAHYKGTGCAEIAENLPGNLAHAITYIWRAGDKPDQPELREIDKALWWLEREMHRAKFLALSDDDYDEDEQTLPCDILKPGQDVFYEHRAHPRNKSKKKLRSLTQHPFYLFAAERMEAAGLTTWKAAVVHSLVLYTINLKPAALQSAINHINQRRGTLDRIRPLAPDSGLDTGRGLEP